MQIARRLTIVQPSRALLSGGLVFAVLTIAAGACRGASEPGPREFRAPDGAKVYALRQVAGDALPAVGVDHEHLRLTVIADTLWLSPDGTGVRRSIERTLTSTALPPGEATHDRSEHFTWRVAGDGFTAEFPCPDFASCVSSPHLVGRLTELELVLDYALYLRAPLSYVRVH